MKRQKFMRTLVRCVVCVLFLFGMVLWSKPAHAYSFMIRHDYVGCAQCHADPAGGSLLTPYGRAQGEVLLRSQWGRDQNAEPGKMAEFLFGALKLPDNLWLGGDVRGLYLRVTPLHKKTTTRMLLMQADLTGEYRVDRLRIHASVGYADEGALGAAITRNPEQNLVSRAHWLGVEFGSENQFLFRAGRMNLPFGLRTIEHTLWARSLTRTNSNDQQQHGLAIAYTGGDVRGEAQLIVGNWQLRPPEYREFGYSAYVEVSPLDRLAIGASSLITHSDRDVQTLTPMYRQAHGIFGRFSPHKWLVIGTEADVLFHSQPPTPTAAAKNRTGAVGFLQLDLEPWQGLHLIGTGELSTLDFDQGFSWGGWGSVAWFFAPHADVRLDFAQHDLAVGPSRLGMRTVTLQGHIFL